jgi:Pyruvate/2-oxoacid:ferredoxin oxidoreductase delta subunit
MADLNYSEVINSEKTHLPVIDYSKCTKCDECYINCPLRAIVKETSSACAKCVKYCISMKVPCNPENYVFCYEKCNMCGLCVSDCIYEAIYWHNMIKSYQTMNLK